MKKAGGLEMPSPGSVCLDEVILNVDDVSGYNLSVTFASLFDVIGVYQVTLVRSGECLVNICDESHYDVMAEAIAKIQEIVPEPDVSERLSGALYEKMLEMSGDDLYERQPYFKK